MNALITGGSDVFLQLCVMGEVVFG